MVINNKIPRTFVFQTDKLTKLKNIIIKLDVTSSEFVQRAEQICIETHYNGHGYQYKIPRTFVFQTDKLTQLKTLLLN